MWDIYIHYIHIMWDNSTYMLHANDMQNGERALPRI
jgi:hypothetical protein